MLKQIASLTARMVSGSISEPAAIAEANALRARALHLVFNDACDKALEDEGRRIVAAAEALVLAARKRMEEADSIAADLALCIEEGGTLGDFAEGVLDEEFYASDTERRHTAAEIIEHLLNLRVITAEQAAQAGFS